MMNLLYKLALVVWVVAAPVPAFSDDLSALISGLTHNLTGPSPDWTGPYIGGTIAYAGNAARYCDGFDGDVYDCNAPDDGLPTPMANGAMFGVTGGHDWQHGAVVYGVVADAMVGNLLDVAGDADFPSYTCGNGCGVEVRGIAMLRGRIGYPMGHALPYASAGMAITQATVFETDGPAVDGQFVNGVVGIGADYRISDTMTAGVEVLQFLESSEPIINDGFCTGCGATAYEATIARATVTYRF